MRRLIVAALIALMPLPALAETLLTDDEAKAVIEKNWRAAYLHLPLGTFKLVENSGEGGPRSIGPGDLARWYEPMEKAGLIEIDKDAAKATIIVSLTAKGRALTASDNETMLALPYGSQTIQTIKGNKSIDPAHEGYRIYNVAYSILWDEVVAKVLTLCGKEVSPEQKALVLLKYDASEEAWTVAAEDDANQGDDYCTQNVTDAIAALP